MLKYLVLFIFLIAFFNAVKAQTHEDSVVNHSYVDSVMKHSPADSVVRQPVDSAVKHSCVDIVAKHQPVDSVARHSPVKSVVKHPPNDIAVKHSPVKTLSDERYNAYLMGEDLDNMSLAGELNHFPLPDKVLKFKKQLDLSPIQIGKLNQLATALHRKKLEMGGFIIRNEKMLDSLFRIKRQDEGSVIFYANRSGLYYGELRGAILMACYNTEKLLTDAQVKKLEALEKTN